MTQQPARPQQCRINVTGSAIDGADDVKTEKIGEQTVGEVQDGGDQFAIVGTARHQSRIGSTEVDWQ